MRRFVSVGIVCGVLISANPVAAMQFPDVPQTHAHAEGIYALNASGVIGGNPDGTFRPGEAVNRAAMLKMVFLATGIVPDPLDRGCFPDVERNSWYEPYVCAAARLQYVNGYSDGNFRPDQNVNKVEAIKMVMEVFELPIPEITTENLKIVNFVDVSLSAWYTSYLVGAFNQRVLPIPGNNSGRLIPDAPLTRGAAASLIYNAVQARLRMDREQQPEEEEEEEESGGDTLAVQFPFEHSGKFRVKTPFAYTFSLDAHETVFIEAKLQSGQPGGLSCRFYLLEDSGFSDEYFLGTQEGNACRIRAAVGPGNYQLQLQPTSPDVTYTVEAVAGEGDGNDGFDEAAVAQFDQIVSGQLEANDLQDWYSFSASAEQRMTVEVSSDVRCIVYAMGDVDLMGFSGPQCNQVYTYTAGTYYVSIGRTAPLSAAQSYSVHVKRIGE